VLFSDLHSAWLISARIWGDIMSYNICIYIWHYITIICIIIYIQYIYTVYIFVHIQSYSYIIFLHEKFGKVDQFTFSRPGKKTVVPRPAANKPTHLR
jgi:hypothetical protein